MRIERPPQTKSLALFFFISGCEILLYLMLYFSRYVKSEILKIDGKSIERAITAPLLKFGTLPSISLNNNVATTSYSPPIDAGIPKSVKLRKKHCITAAAKVPKRGEIIAIQRVLILLSPIILETVMKLLSM